VNLNVVCDRCRAEAGGGDERDGWMQLVCEDCGAVMPLCPTCFRELHEEDDGA
jgi:hypothetical protein